MQQHHRWLDVGVYGFIPVVTALVMAWLARSRDRAKLGKPEAQLRHPGATLILGWCLCGIFPTMAILATIAEAKRGRRTPPWLFAFLSSLSLVALPLLLDYRNARHKLAPDGLHFGRMLGRGGFMRWREICSVRYSILAKWFILRDRDGQVARISAMLVGLPAFALAVLKNVPPVAISGDTRTILEATAGGNPPKLWG